MDCESWSKDGYCAAEYNAGFCRFDTAKITDIYTEDEPYLVTGTKNEGGHCSKTSDCVPHLYCHSNNKCTDPCKTLVMCTSPGPGLQNPGFVTSKHDQHSQPSAKYRCTVHNYNLKCV
ncbi:hypothetical protein LSTR_LSTR007544 [Laodelphax striatellus]|uniref:Uncharacterized protein n=1 Tax=Laodelphax striatellus TaxID=195883 RepID=A0A482XS35_LAOST|nr:hypothetical protein LSTR_LSTR007544 [Laodelphax striatellus]